MKIFLHTFITFLFLLNVIIFLIFLSDKAIKKCEINNNTNYLSIDYHQKISDCLNF